MVINFISLVKNSKANIPNRKELLRLLSTKSPKSIILEKQLNLKTYSNFKRQGNLVINITLFESLNKDVYEYFNSAENYYNLEIDTELDRLKKILEIGKNNESALDNSISKITKTLSLDEFQKKYPTIYKDYDLQSFDNLAYIEQGRILSEISEKTNSLSHIYPYLKLSKSGGSKRIKAYKIFCSFPAEEVFLSNLSFRTLEAFPSKYDEQKKLIEQLKTEKSTKINRESIINLRNSIDFTCSEKLINQNLEVLKETLDSGKLNSLYPKEQEKIIKYFEKIKEILIKNNLIWGDDIWL